MPIMIPKVPTHVPGTASDLSGLLPAAIGMDAPPASAARTAAFRLDSAGVADFVANTFTQQVTDNPGLLGMTIADATRFLGIPPRAIQAAFDQLAARSGISLKDGTGSDLKIGDILKSAPLGTGRTLLTQWFDRQGPALKRVLFGAALGAVAVRQGLGAIGQLGLNVSIVQQKNGSLALSLVPDASGKGLAVQASGQLNIPLGNGNGNGSSSFTASARVTDDPRAQLTVGLALALSGSSSLVLGATAGTDGEGYSLNYVNGGFSAGIASENGKTNVSASQALGSVTISGETNGDSGMKAQVSVSGRL